MQEVTRLLMISDEVKKVYPEEFMDILAMKNVCNFKKHKELDRIRNGGEGKLVED